MDIECCDALTGETRAAWRHFIENSNHQHPRQDPRFAASEEATGNRVIYAIGRIGGNICAVGMFSLKPSRFVPGRYSAAYALSGPICDDAEALADFIVGVGTQPEFSKVDCIRITPYWLDGEADALASILRDRGFQLSDPTPHRDTGLIDITPDEDALRSSFSKSARRKVRLVEKSDIEIREVTRLEDAAVFFDRLNRLVIERHGLTPVSEAEYEAGFRDVYSDPAAGVIFSAYHEGTFLGGLLLYRSGKTAHARRYVADPGAAEAVKNLRVAPSLWLKGMLWAREHGCTHFDVEGFLPVEDKNHPNFNVFEYKRELGPVHVRRIAEHSLVLNPTFNKLNEIPGRMKVLIKRLLGRD